jgi:hypothetical protein
MAPEVRSEYEARRAHIKEGLLAELKSEFYDILVASLSSGVSEPTRASAVRAKQVATELTVALRAGLESLARVRGEGLGALPG